MNLFFYYPPCLSTPRCMSSQEFFFFFSPSSLPQHTWVHEFPAHTTWKWDGFVCLGCAGHHQMTSGRQQLAARTAAEDLHHSSRRAWMLTLYHVREACGRLRRVGRRRIAMAKALNRGAREHLTIICASATASAWRQQSEYILRL